GLPQVDRDVRLDEAELLRVVVVDMGDEDRRERRRFPRHLGWVEGFRGVEAGDPLHQVQGKVVPEAESLSRLEELDEVLLAEVERRTHVKPDSRIAILDEDLVPADLADAAKEGDFRHGTPRSAVNPRAAPRSRPEPPSSTGSSAGAVPRAPSSR